MWGENKQRIKGLASSCAGKTLVQPASVRWAKSPTQEVLLFENRKPQGKMEERKLCARGLPWENSHQKQKTLVIDALLLSIQWPHPPPPLNCNPMKVRVRQEETLLSGEEVGLWPLIFPSMCLWLRKRRLGRNSVFLWAEAKSEGEEVPLTIRYQCAS